jgi:acyl dehydratase
VTTTLHSLDELTTRVGEHLGHSDWLVVTQERVNTFADATDDHQWIHIDVERARKESPYGGPIAHGYLTLSLVIPMISQVLVIEGLTMSVNYGLNKVRFPAPVPVGARIRLGATLTSVEDVPGGLQILLDCVIEQEGAGKPVCVAQAVLRHFADPR